MRQEAFQRLVGEDPPGAAGLLLGFYKDARPRSAPGSSSGRCGQLTFLSQVPVGGGHAAWKVWGALAVGVTRSIQKAGAASGAEKRQAEEDPGGQLWQEVLGFPGDCSGLRSRLSVIISGKQAAPALSVGRDGAAPPGWGGRWVTVRVTGHQCVRSSY